MKINQETTSANNMPWHVYQGRITDDRMHARKYSATNGLVTGGYLGHGVLRCSPNAFSRLKHKSSDKADFCRRWPSSANTLRTLTQRHHYCQLSCYRTHRPAHHQRQHVIACCQQASLRAYIHSYINISFGLQGLSCIIRAHSVRCENHQLLTQKTACTCSGM